MKISGDFLVSLGLPQNKFFREIMRVLNNDSYTEQGIKEIITGFLAHKLPHNVKTMRGENPPSLELLKIFYDYTEESKRVSMVALDKPLAYKIYGLENIEQGALDQMDNAMRLPVAVAGALSADSHQGYSLPIGGILATDNVVIPNAVGVDISCRIRFSSFDEEFPVRNTLFKEELRKALKTQTLFGTGAIGHGINLPERMVMKDADSPVFEDPRWNIPTLKKFNFRDQAFRQFGTSGSGNHFCDFGTYKTEDDEVNLPLALMTHSGSRGVGNQIAKLYHAMAVKNFDNKDFQGFAWLDLNTDLGKEYWDAMEICGEFAKACHELIHNRICKFLKISPVHVYQTNHNFAWRENHIINGISRDVIVHRKGAVRAFKDEIGIIAGDMVHDSFIVKGKGNESSLCSCSHGSGRVMSRQSAKEKFTHKQMENILNEFGVELLEGGLDECPMAYKDVSLVMKAQSDLVDIVGEFNPKIVMMNDDKGDD